MIVKRIPVPVTVWWDVRSCQVCLPRCGYLYRCTGTHTRICNVRFCSAIPFILHTIHVYVCHVYTHTYMKWASHSYNDMFIRKDLKNIYIFSFFYNIFKNNSTKIIVDNTACNRNPQKGPLVVSFWTSLLSR